jgi:hypothetical protein
MTPYRDRKEAGDFEAQDAEAAEEAEAEDNGPGLTVAELKEELKARGLQTSGSKAELEERLAADHIEGADA